MENGKVVCPDCLTQGRRTLLTPKKAKNGPHKDQWYVNCFSHCHAPRPGTPPRRGTFWFFWALGIKPPGVLGDGPVESVPSTPSSSPAQHPLASTLLSSASLLQLDNIPPSFPDSSGGLPSHTFSISAPAMAGPSSQPSDWVLPAHSYPIQPTNTLPSYSLSLTQPPPYTQPPSLPHPPPLSQPAPLPQSQPPPYTAKCAHPGCNRSTPSKGVPCRRTMCKFHCILAGGCQSTKHQLEHLTSRQRTRLSSENLPRPQDVSSSSASGPSVPLSVPSVASAVSPPRDPLSFTALDAPNEDTIVLDAPNDDAPDLFDPPPLDDHDDYSFLDATIIPIRSVPPSSGILVDVYTPEHEENRPQHTDHLNKLWRKNWENSHEGHVRFRCDEKEYHNRTRAGKREFDTYFWDKEDRCILRTLQDTGDEHSEVPFFPLFSMQEDAPRYSHLAALQKLSGEDLSALEYWDGNTSVWKGCSQRHRFTIKPSGYLFLRRAGLTSCKNFDAIMEERQNTLPTNAKLDLPRQRQLRRQDAKQAKRTAHPEWTSSSSSSSSSSAVLTFSIPTDSSSKRRKLDDLPPSSQASSSESSSGMSTRDPSSSPICVHKLLADIAVDAGYSRRNDFGTISPTITLSDDDTPSPTPSLDRPSPRRLPEPQTVTPGGGRSKKPWPNGWPAIDIIDGFEQMKDLRFAWMTTTARFEAIYGVRYVKQTFSDAKKRWNQVPQAFRDNMVLGGRTNLGLWDFVTHAVRLRGPDSEVIDVDNTNS
ncbi:hypothetical protein CONPUDRAFT_160161 [Coniophora puteana RWD-64-598 SS2]|uniref:Uncharacterized protein n=1 Tax=Coniophora puteana (strain RWD-64-598) TaxID=741705 RepID=R7SHB0_CONPW|nr:uncharacterized protein CONPUDRAFT_160161 [Coniophora puteana RWD-64-598 SS2]EIW74459.1 hypothetical protein CONPUDRAFT_160161 [Coniophora puteana RWD-64-598 SS2]